MTKIGETTRYALVAVAVADVGIGLILLGTPALGLFRNVVAWALIALALPAAAGAISGRLYRVGVGLVGANAAFVALAAYQILVIAGRHTPRPAMTAGLTALVLAVDLAMVLFWAHLSRRDRQLSTGRHVQ